MGMTPPTDLIVQGWLATCPGVSGASGAQVGTRVPAPDTWDGQFYVTELVYVSNTDPYCNIKDITAQLDVWGKGVADQTISPPWYATAVLANAIETAAHESGSSPGAVVSPVGEYDPVNVREVSIVDGFVRVEDEDSGVARYRGSLRFIYIGE